MQQQRRAYQFISKLYKPKFGDWFDKKVKEDVEFGISNAGNPDAIQSSTAGCPKTLEIAFNLAVIEERSIEVKQRREANKQQSSDGEETNPSNQGLTSYAKANAKRKDRGNINDNMNNNKTYGYPPGTKPSTIPGFRPCNNWNHKPGEDLDHMRSDCPYNRKESHAAAQTFRMLWRWWSNFCS